MSFIDIVKHSVSIMFSDMIDLVTKESWIIDLPVSELRGVIILIGL